MFNGPEPSIELYDDEAAERAGVATIVRGAIEQGVSASEIGIFVRTREQLPRARAAAHEADQQVFELSESAADSGERISIGTMHLAKGLEFKVVIVMACDDDLLPLSSRIEAVADVVELDDVYESERQLFYVACTRARDQLVVTGVAPGSEFIGDLRAT